MKTQPDFTALPDFYKKYVQQVQDLDMMEALRTSDEQLRALIQSVPKEKEDFRYAEGKWTIREVIVHLTDSERIFAYRALRFARNDNTVLPGFDQDIYVPESNASFKSLEQLSDSVKQLRVTTIDLFESFTKSMLNRKGSANGNVISVINLGYVIAGHGMHHLNILKERYVKNFS